MATQRLAWGSLSALCGGGSPEDRKQNLEITLKYGLPRDQFKGEEIFKLDNKSKQILLVDVFYHF